MGSLSSYFFFLSCLLFSLFILLQLDSTWIVFNQPSEGQGSIEYAGFLMALGLNGHLINLTEFETMEYLQTRQEQMVIGLLIGLSASRFGMHLLPFLLAWV